MYREMFCKCGWAELLFLIPAALISRIWIDVFPLACLYVTALGEGSQLPPLLWNRSRSMGKVCLSVRLILSCKKGGRLVRPVTWVQWLQSPVTDAGSVTRQWQSVPHGALESFMACGQAGLGWATLSAALRSSCGAGSRRDLHFGVRQTSHFCPIVKMIIWPKEETEQVVEGRSFAKQCKNPAFAVTQHTVLVWFLSISLYKPVHVSVRICLFWLFLMSSRDIRRGTEAFCFLNAVSITLVPSLILEK